MALNIQLGSVYLDSFVALLLYNWLGLDHGAPFCIFLVYSSLGTPCIRHSECISSVVGVHLKWRFAVCPVPLPIPLGIPPESDESI